MKARDVVGRCIVAVRHGKVQTSAGGTETVVVEIELDNGALLRPFGFETPDTPDATILYVKPRASAP